MTGNSGTFGRTFAAALAGGTASVIGGGKFANGAISGAMVTAWNHTKEEIEEALKVIDERFRQRREDIRNQTKFIEGELDRQRDIRAEKITENLAGWAKNDNSLGWIIYEMVDLAVGLFYDAGKAIDDVGLQIAKSFPLYQAQQDHIRELREMRDEISKQQDKDSRE